MMTTIPEIVLGVTGSIGAYRSADIIRHLRDMGYGVTCVMTHRAQKFVAPITMEALTERRVYTDLFDTTGGPIVHTALADRARLVLVAPATANIIAKMANGVADDMLSCVLLATRAKVLIAPAMNVHMWQHPAVQRNVTTLKRLGYRFVGPDVGKLACGYEAIGHLAEIDEILRVVRQLAPVPSGTPTAPAKATSVKTHSKNKSKSRSKHGKKKR